MASENLNFNLLDNYLAILNQLSRDNKLELIAKLSKSLQEEKPTQSVETTRSFGELFGALKSDKSAEEQIEEIRAARKFDRNIEEL